MKPNKITKVESAQHSIRAMRSVLGALAPLIPSLNDIYYKVKGEYKKDKPVKINKRKEFGYYVNTQSPELFYLLKLHKCSSLIDLGAGAGILLYALRELDYKTKGIENEQILVNIAQRMALNVTKGDILKITSKDIKDYDCIYFWEPIIDEKLNKEFINNLVECLLPHQVIIMRGATWGDTNLMNHPKVKFIESYISLKVFKLK